MNPIISSREPRSMQDWMRDNPFTRQARLAASPLFRQAGPEGQRRMSENVQKGLPANIDPQRIFVSGYTGGGTIPQYSAVMGAMGFGGGWGSVGMDRERKGSTGKLTSGPALGSAGSSGYDLARGMRGGPQPAEATPTPSMPSGGSPLSFTGFGGMMREQERETNRGLGSLTGFGGVPRFPFSNY